jgi:DNA-binding transcriptional regulator YhcF (GntR family)
MPKSDPDHTNHTDHTGTGLLAFLETAKINPRSVLPAYAQIASNLRLYIMAAQLAPGTPLPSEPELAERWGVSRDTVRKAMRLVREMGVANSRRGVGHFVTRTPEIRRVGLAPGSAVTMRLLSADDQGLPGEIYAYQVAEPGKPPVAYPVARTVLVAGS